MFSFNLFRPVFADKKPVFKSKYDKGRINVLIIGETGSGKSTLLNMFTNYFEDGNLDDIKISIPTQYFPDVTSNKHIKHSESDINDRSKAQTKKANEYIFNHIINKMKYNFNFIDTPGLNDTEGNNQDEKNIDVIMEAAIKAKHLNSIILVLNGTNARITSGISSVITRFKGSLPDSIMNNIICVMTMCRKETCNFTDFEELGIKPKHIIYINNTAFSSDPSMWDDRDILELEWKKSLNQCKTLEKYLMDMENIPTDEFAKIREIRNNTKKNLYEAQVKFENLQNLIEEIHKKESDLRDVKEDIEKNKNFKVKKTITKVVLVPTAYKNTICTKCNVACHENCNIEEIKEGDCKTGFVNCVAFGGKSNCGICDGKCDIDSHYHGYGIPTATNVQVDDELQDIKQKYLDAMGMNDKLMSESQKLKVQQDALDKEFDDIISKFKKDCEEVKSVCSGFNFVKELYDLIDCLEKKSLDLTSLEAKKKNVIFINNVKNIISKLN